MLVLDDEKVDEEEETHLLHREIEKLRVENRTLKKEVGEIKRRRCV